MSWATPHGNPRALPYEKSMQTIILNPQEIVHKLNPPPRSRDGVTGPCFVFKVSFSINLLQHVLMRLIQLLLSVCSCLITRNKGGPYMSPGRTGRTICSSNFRDKILRRFGMDFQRFWLPFRLQFLNFFMFSGYIFRASNLH